MTKKTTKNAYTALSIQYESEPFPSWECNVPMLGILA
jgi:hypothetical protein